ncbi:MAG: OmpH family outer membrane protein [Bacteroidales bacterium]|nr:OmpH family outer membrane protein [Bacteroidales bacterium]
MNEEINENLITRIEEDTTSQISQPENNSNNEQEPQADSCNGKKPCNCGLVMGAAGLVFGIAALVLALLLCFGKIGNKPQTDPVTIFDNKEASEAPLEIAYINLDTLLLTYNYAIKLQEDLTLEQSKAEQTIQRRAKKFEEMYMTFQEKASKGLFMSEASQRAQMSELEKEQQAIENLQASLGNQLLEKQAQMNKEIYDSVLNFVSTYSAGRYKVVLGNMGGLNVVYAQNGMDITNDVVVKLNQRYGGILESSIKQDETEE